MPLHKVVFVFATIIKGMSQIVWTEATEATETKQLQQTEMNALRTRVMATGSQIGLALQQL